LLRVCRKLTVGRHPNTETAYDVSEALSAKRQSRERVTLAAFPWEVGGSLEFFNIPAAQDDAIERYINSGAGGDTEWSITDGISIMPYAVSIIPQNLDLIDGLILAPLWQILRPPY
jgi:hypothetical protein